MQNALPMHVVEFEALNLGAVDQRGMRCGQPQSRTPNAHTRLTLPAAFHLGQRALKDARPRQVSPIERTTERIEDQELDALKHRLGHVLILQS